MDAWLMMVRLLGLLSALMLVACTPSHMREEGSRVLSDARLIDSYQIQRSGNWRLQPAPTEGVRMKVIYTEVQKKHYPKNFLSSGAPQSNPEVPERADRLMASARSARSGTSPSRTTPG